MSVLTDNTAKLRKILEKVENLPEIPQSVAQATPTISVSSGGLITATATQEAGAVAAGTKSATRQLTTKGGTTITPGTSEQTAVSAGTYVTGDIKVAAAAGGKQCAMGSIEVRTPASYLTLSLDFKPSALIISGFSVNVTNGPPKGYYQNGSGRLYHVLYDSSDGTYNFAQKTMTLGTMSGKTTINVSGSSGNLFTAATYYWMAME